MRASKKKCVLKNANYNEVVKYEAGYISGEKECCKSVAL